MFGFGKKNQEVVKEDQTLYSPVDGKLIDLSKVSDPVFAKKIMGDGFAVEPESGKIVSPASGTVTLVQGHAIGLTRFDGLEILIHMGIDTVSLNGTPFDIQVKEGQIVSGGDSLVEADWKQVEDAGFEKTTMVLITNTNDALESFSLSRTVDSQVTAGQEVGKAVAK